MIPHPMAYWQDLAGLSQIEGPVLVFVAIVVAAGLFVILTGRLD